MSQRTVVELVDAIRLDVNEHEHGAEGSFPDFREEAAAMRARLTALEAFADEVRRSQDENVTGHYEGCDAGVFVREVKDALAKLPVKP